MGLQEREGWMEGWSENKERVEGKATKVEQERKRQSSTEHEIKE